MEIIHRTRGQVRAELRGVEPSRVDPPLIHSSLMWAEIG